MLTFGRLSYLSCVAGALMVALVGCSSSSGGDDPVAGQSGSAGNTSTNTAGKKGGTTGTGTAGNPGAAGAPQAGSTASVPDAGVDAPKPVVDAPPPPDKTYSVDIGIYDIDDTGSLKFRTLAPLLNPEDKLEDTNGTGIFGGEIFLSPDGKFLYASVCDASDTAPGKARTVRDHNYIAAFGVGATGALEPLGHYATDLAFPRGAAIDPEGKWLVSIGHDNGSMTVFQVGTDGKLTKRWGSSYDFLPSGSAAGLAVVSSRAGNPPFAITQAGKRVSKVWQLRTDMMPPTTVGSIESPTNAGTSFLAPHPKLKVVYDARDSGNAINAYSYDNMGRLTMLGMPARSIRNADEYTSLKDAATSDQAKIDAPVHFEINPAGTLGISSNYGGGVFTYKIAGDGSLEVAKNYFVGYSSHGAKFHPTKNIVYIAVKDSSKIVQMSIDPATGALTPLPTPEVLTDFRKPRHLTVSADGKYAFVINERSFNAKQ